jgi:hypothetical protein
VGEAIERECIQALRSAIAESGPYPQFAKENPLGQLGVKTRLNDLEQRR